MKLSDARFVMKFGETWALLAVALVAGGGIGFWIG